MAASTAAASWWPALPNRWPGTRKATPPKRCARYSNEGLLEPVAQALMPAASPLLRTLASATHVETSLDTAGTSAYATGAPMSRYAQQPLDFAKLKTVGLEERGGKVKAADFAAVYQPGSGVAGLLDSLPHVLAADSFRAVGDALALARRQKRAILWGMGGHVVKCGLAPVLLDLMRRGYATGFALNGSAAIHDFEIALAGHTSEDVEAVLTDGRFGAAEETGREMNQAIVEGVRDGIGMGEALGKWLAAQASLAGAGASLVLQAYQHSTPVTVHVAIGTDT